MLLGSSKEPSVGHRCWGFATILWPILSIGFGQRIAFGSKRFFVVSRPLGKDGDSDILWVLSAKNSIFDPLEGKCVLDEPLERELVIVLVHELGGRD